MEQFWTIIGLILGVGAGLARVLIFPEDVKAFALSLGTWSGLTVVLFSIFDIFRGKKGSRKVINFIIGIAASFFIFESIIKPFVENMIMLGWW